MAIHYVSPVGHATCESKSGNRRSPMIGPSYDADQQLLDEATGRTIYRHHTDGTVIWDTDIVSADKNCPYGDRSVPSQERRQAMYNDLYRRLKKKSHRIRAFFHVALPNSFTMEQAIECAERMAYSFSKKLSRPVEYSIHHKKGNLHIHFGMPEWEWTNGNWKELKVESHYIDKQGNPIYGKNFLDENGNDIRVPYKDENGNQKRGKKNDLLWKRKYFQTFDKDRCGWLHEEVDRQIDLQLERNNSADKVIRPDKDVREKLKNAHLVSKHIGPQSYKTKDDRYWSIMEHNARVKQFEQLLAYNKNKQTEAKDIFSETANEIKELSKSVSEKEESLKEKEFAYRKFDSDIPIKNYIENVLRPANIFIGEAEKTYNAFLSMKREITRPLLNSLDAGVRSTQADIAKITNNKNATEKDKARLRYLNKNVGSMIILRNAISEIRKTDYTKKIRQTAHKKWNGLSKWARCYFVKSRCGDTDARIYQEYLKLKGNLPEHEKFVPSPIKAPDTKELENQIRKTADTWAFLLQTDEHKLPTGISILSDIVSAEATITETAPEDIFVIPDTYQPTKSIREYAKELAQIAQQEATASRQGTGQTFSKKTAEVASRQTSASDKNTTVPAKPKNTKDIPVAPTASRQGEGNIPNQSITAGTAPQQVPASDNKKQPNFVPLSEPELLEAENRWNKISDERDNEKKRCVELLISRRIMDYIREENVKRSNYIQEHFDDPDYAEPPLITYKSAKEQMQQIYKTQSINFRNHAKAYGVNITRFQTLSKKASDLYAVILKSYEAMKIHKKPKRKKPASNELSATKDADRSSR